MKHLFFSPTPITKLSYYSKKMGVNMTCKRDDLFLEAGGGNKARMLQYILSDVNSLNTDIIVTAGGPCSNFNRACALMCSKLGIKMHLIEYTDEPNEWESLNYYLAKLTGIKTTRCSKNKVSQTINEVLCFYKKKHIRAKFIYGGGKSFEGFYSYFEAISELKEQVENIDHLFVACSTGTTLTGICAGMQQHFPKAVVHAISTARRYEDEIKVLEDDIQVLNSHLKTSFDFKNLSFTDSFLCGGYGKYNEELFNTVKDCLSHEGIVIDPTYSGKAFYGMLKVLKESPNIFIGKDLVFWHTGGLLNLLSTKYDKATR